MTDNILDLSKKWCLGVKISMLDYSTHQIAQGFIGH